MSAGRPYETSFRSVGSFGHPRQLGVASLSRFDPKRLVAGASSSNHASLASSLTRAIIVHSIGTPTSGTLHATTLQAPLHTHTHTILNPSTTAYPRRDRRRIIRRHHFYGIHVLALHASPSLSPFASKLCFNATQGFHCPCTFLSSHPTALTGQRSKARGSDSAK